MPDNKSEQKEALKILADWTKWLVTLETAIIGATLTAAKGHLNFVSGIQSVLTTTTVFAATTFIGVISLCFSIYWAVYLVYGIPEVMEQLPASKNKSINEMQSDRLSHNLFYCQVRIYWGAAVGSFLCLISAGYYIVFFR